MSASNKKKEKAASPAEAMKKQRSQRKLAEEQKKERINTIIGSIIGIIVLGLVLWNQGLFQNTTAFSINGQKFTAAQVQMHYTNQLYNALMGQYTPEEGGVAYDMSISSDEQMYSETETWHDFFSKEACRSLATNYLFYEMAQKDGYTLPAEGLEQLEATKTSLSTAWIGRATSKKAYFNMVGVSEDDYLKMEEIELYANYYQQHQYESYEHTEEEYAEYYEENKNSLDILSYSQLVYVYTDNIPTDEEGNEIERTEEEQAIADNLKLLTELEADSALEALESGSSLTDVEEEFTLYASSVLLNAVKPSATLSGTDAATQWLLDESRKEGDMAKVEDVSGTSTKYSVLVFEGRERADELMGDIRHILIPAQDDAESTEAPTEEQWDAAEELAQELLDGWVESGADPEDFSALAIEHSGDSQTAASGGILTSTTAYDSYAPDMLAWISDTNRESGDYTIVKDTSSTTEGWQILYFDDWGLPIWEQSTKYSLSTEKTNAWVEEVTADLENLISYDKSLEDVQAQSLFG